VFEISGTNDIERRLVEHAQTTWSNLTDEDLVATPIYEDREWLSELMVRYEGKLVGCAHRMVRPEEIEDAVQEINERIIKGLRHFRGESAVSTWIFAVARNTCLDVRRRRRPAVYASNEILAGMATETGPEEVFDISILACRTALAVRDLSKGQAAVVMLRLGQGLSTADTAAQLGVTEDAVKSRLRRAREQLRSDLARELACPQCGPGTYAIARSTII